MERDELAAWLRLALTPGLGNAPARRLLAAFGLPQAVFAQPPEALAAIVGERMATALQEEPPTLAGQLEGNLAWLARDDVPRELLTLGDANYPAALLQIEDPPLVLWRMGRLATPPGPAVAIVGSRNPTPQGTRNAQQFAQAMAQAGVTVVSGLALGIDGAAHRGALAGAAEGGLATIAVVGTGLDTVYPRQHLALAREIAAAGMLVSEYPLGTPPLPANFPRRNRLIAGLSQGTLVVEAALPSGSLITARLAVEQGKEVFAIPGSIHSPLSRGCHALLRQGAKLVESAQDVLEELRLAPAREVAAPPPSEESGGLLEAMGYDPVGLDALVARTGIAAGELQARLLELELAGEVGRLPGGLYQRVGTG